MLKVLYTVVLGLSLVAATPLPCVSITAINGTSCTIDVSCTVWDDESADIQDEVDACIANKSAVSVHALLASQTWFNAHLVLECPENETDVVRTVTFGPVIFKGTNATVDVGSCYVLQVAPYLLEGETEEEAIARLNAHEQSTVTVKRNIKTRAIYVGIMFGSAVFISLVVKLVSLRMCPSSPSKKFKRLDPRFSQRMNDAEWSTT